MSTEIVTEFYPVLICAVLVLIIPTITFVERRLKRRRKVLCVVWDWRLEFRRVRSVDQAVFSFETYLLNPRPSPIRLRGASVELRRDDGRVAASHVRYSGSDESLKALDLQPWQRAHARMYAVFEGEEAGEILGFRQADLSCIFSGGITLRWKIAGRGDFVASRKKPGSERKDFVASYKRLGSERKDFEASLKKPGSERKYYIRSRWRRLTGPQKTPAQHR